MKTLYTMKKVIITCLLLVILVFISLGNYLSQPDTCPITNDNVSTANDEDKPTLYAFIVGFKPPLFVIKQATQKNLIEIGNDTNDTHMIYR